MSLKTLSLLSASIFLSAGLTTASYANWNWHTHRTWTNCHNGVCHRYINNYSKHCVGGACRVYRTHYNWNWRR
ncbi:hypothetical protein ACNVED_15455 (plasmid) [Legionella sp. D16C41]|uniref:hypothetical protein n=1 Tax=Legionella sp. D16C41 TaxID=3402688 RepID=UPI003AF44D2E